ncbi:hypothetical protein H4W26_000303 [Nesterenkonia halotolerans]|uniref:Uncharacterized protein n=1 Tax=Nesterenkonia halotolerans TaxID=225325 RepID=A0ABR9J3G6_9MICC|nr:hypothetical protein [Nesterenkonia halotolerans]
MSHIVVARRATAAQKHRSRYAHSESSPLLGRSCE